MLCKVGMSSGRAYRMAISSAALAGFPDSTQPAPEGKAKVSEVNPPAPNPLIKIVAEHNQTALVNVIDFFNRKDIRLTSLEILEPNLESVFLHLTGKKLRE
jgi:ABC-2 type transport system ATP-binding protein